MKSLPIVALMTTLRTMPVSPLQCMAGEGRLSDPDNFELMECEREAGRYGELVCYKQFGKDLGDQIRRGCTYFWPQDYDLLRQIEHDSGGATDTVLLDPPPQGEPPSPLGPTCRREVQEFGRRMSACYCTSRPGCNRGGIKVNGYFAGTVLAASLQILLIKFHGI